MCSRRNCRNALNSILEEWLISAQESIGSTPNVAPQLVHRAVRRAAARFFLCAEDCDQSDLPCSRLLAEAFCLLHSQDGQQLML